MEQKKNFLAWFEIVIKKAHTFQFLIWKVCLLNQQLNVQSDSLFLYFYIFVISLIIRVQRQTIFVVFMIKTVILKVFKKTHKWTILKKNLFSRGAQSQSAVQHQPHFVQNLRWNVLSFCTHAIFEGISVIWCYYIVKWIDLYIFKTIINWNLWIYWQGPV